MTLLVVTPLIERGHDVTTQSVAARGFWRLLARLTGERGEYVALFELVP